MKTTAIFVTCCIAALATVAAAQTPGGRFDPTQPLKRTDVTPSVKAHFASLDANRDGVVTTEERKAAREKRLADRANQGFDLLDSNKDGAISRTEFDARPKRHFAGAGPETGKERRMRRGKGRDGATRFGADANKDGRVSESEMLASALSNFDAADANHDGVLTPEERKAARSARRASRL